MNSETLYIKWDTGEMEIVLENFFPTTKKRFNKLLKIIRFDWQNQDEIIEFLKVYFQNSITNNNYAPYYYQKSKTELEKYQRHLNFLDEQTAKYRW